ncbi:MAG: TatA/E family twin arginine-targeting protein translocase [Hydrococcus sp. Prado102]|jgi:sec-independent protein translocase protein TatA|nr:TatA/E family twin arginine-targeting protein translocase [Hydrococcus sp. Prado102]
MNFFGIGLPEMILIMVVALLIFGPKKLPEIGRSLGKAIRGFQEASKEFENEFKKEAQQLEESVKMQAQLEEGKSSQPLPTKESEAVKSATSDQLSKVESRKSEVES